MSCVLYDYYINKYYIIIIYVLNYYTTINYYITLINFNDISLLYF